MSTTIAPTTDFAFEDAEAVRGKIDFSRDGREFVMRAEQWLPADPDAIWAFVSDCRHMNYVIPPFVRFEVLSLGEDEDPPALGPGVNYEYKLYLHGIGVFWRTVITEVDRPRRFVDIQDKGPYASFAHEHTFEPENGGTMTADVIRYRPPGGPLAGLINAAMVRRDLRKLFKCRHGRLAKLFADGGDPASSLLGLHRASVSLS
ncbi:MAG: SRPBCC family protein [Planctomycetota bacterium]